MIRCNINSFRNLVRLAAVFMALVVASPALAQEQAAAPADPAAAAASQNTEGIISAPQSISPEDIIKRRINLQKPEVMPQELGSLFFTAWQHALLQEAKRGFISRPPTAGDLTEDPMSAAPKPRGIREIALSGILFKGKEDWTIWLNGQRVTPDALPEQVLDLRVHRDYVDIKWFDTFNNLIFPIRIRPHQRFNLDSRIFLPGTSAL